MLCGFFLSVAEDGAQKSLVEGECTWPKIDFPSFEVAKFWSGKSWCLFNLVV
jgi:hypothetical protein